MPRIRTVKPEFFKDDELAELGPYAMLLFEGLWCLADRMGRLEDRPKRIKAEILPYFDVDVNDLLDQLQNAGFIVRYTVENDAYIVVSKFTEHQRITGKEAETPSKIPPPPGFIDEESDEKQRGNTRETSETTGKEGNRKGKRTPLTPQGESLDFIEALPESHRTPEVIKAYREYEEMRRENKKTPWKPITIRKNVEHFSKFTPQQVADAFEKSVRNQYQGVFAGDVSGKREAKPLSPPVLTEEQLAEATR